MNGSFRRRRSFPSWVPVVALVLQCAAGRAGVPLRGDADAARALADALRAADSNAAEHGAIVFTCHEEETITSPGREDVVRRSVAAGTVVWDGDFARWDVRSDTSDSELPGGDRPVEPEREKIVIRTPDSSIHYSVKGGIVSAGPATGSAPLPVMQARPGEGWFRVALESRRTWAQMLDAENPIPTVTGMDAERDGSEVTVTLTYEGGATYRIVGDLVRGVITEAGNHGRSGTSLSERTEWGRNQDGRVYPLLMERRRAFSQSGGGESENLWRLKITRYDPEFRPARRAFTVAGLDLPPGTLVRYHDRNQRIVRQVRTGPPRSPDAEADAVIDRLTEQNADGDLAGGGGDR